MDFLREMLGLEEIGNAIKSVVIDEDRAKQRLLRLDIVRRKPERGIGAAREAGSFGEILDCWHSIPWPALLCARRISS